jgi:hypothetical protein
VGKGSCTWKTTGFNYYCPYDNCRMRGYFLKGHGQALRFNLDTSLTAGNDSSTARARSSRAATQFERRYLAVT